MRGVLVRSVGYLFLIAMGYVLKKKGKLFPQDKNALGMILMYVTLPCSFVANFRDFQMKNSLFLFCVFGFVLNIVLIGVAKLMSRGRDGVDRAEYILQGCGYNIGAFATPYLSTVMDPSATVVSSIFDIGHSMVSLGIVYPIAKMEVSSEQWGMKERITYVLKKLFGSVPFMTYLVMWIISMLGIRLPAEVSDTAKAFGAPSIILTLILIGIGLDFNLSKENVRDVVKLLVLRYGVGLALAAILLNLPMLSAIESKTLCYCVLAPATSISPTYANLCGCKPEVYSAVSSLTIIITLLIFMGLTIL